MLPNVFIVGAAKSGTTTLADALGQHPDVYVPTLKEPHFLLPERARHGLPTAIHGLEDYAALYEEAGSARHRVDASVLYLPFARSCAPNILDLAGREARIIIILREPLSRARSAYRHFMRYNSVDLGSFAHAVATEPALGTGNPMRCFFQLSQYVDPVKTYQARFPNVLILTTDALKAEPARVLEQVWDFLDVEHVDVTPRHRNAAEFEWRAEAIRRTLNRLMPPRLRAGLRETVPGAYSAARAWAIRGLGRRPRDDIAVPPEVAALFAAERDRVARELGIRFDVPDHA